MRVPHRSRGFTLIEVLVTMFVAAIGLLAVAGLQAMSKKFNYDAVQRTSASALAQSMVETLRGNPAQLDAYVTSDASGVTSGVDCATSTAQCTPAELAVYDLYRWSLSLAGAESQSETSAAGGLVEPTGCVAKDGTTPGLYIVAVAWRGITGLSPPDSSDPADDPQRNPCGASLDRYDDPLEAGEDDRLRRVIVLNAFITDPNAP